MNEEISDYELLYYIHLKDETALSLLEKKYDSYIRYWINSSIQTYAYLGVEFCDVYSIAKYSFYNAINHYRDDIGKFGAFLKVCIKREIYNVFRSANNENAKINNFSISLDSAVSDENSLTYSEIIEDKYWKSSPRKIFMIKETEEKIYKSINKELHLKVLRLYQNGLSYKEISKSLNIDVKKVDNIIQNLKLKVKNIIKDNVN